MENKKLNLTAFHLVPGDDCFLIKGGKGVVKVSGKKLALMAERVFPLLNGTKSAAEVEELLKLEQSVESTRNLLSNLDQYGLLEYISSPPDSIPDGTVNRYSSLRRALAANGGCGWEAIGELKQAHVALISCNAICEALIFNLCCLGVGKITLFGAEFVSQQDVPKSPFIKEEDVGSTWVDAIKKYYPLARLDTSISWGGELPNHAEDWKEKLSEVSLAVVCQMGPSFFTESLRQLNVAACETGLSWTTVALIENIGVTIGPSIVGSDTPCYRCFELRFKSNIERLDLFEAVERHMVVEDGAVDFGTFLPSVNLLASIATHEIRDLLISDRLALSVANMIAIDLNHKYDSVTHRVLKVPRCDVCSSLQSLNRVHAWG